MVTGKRPLSAGVKRLTALPRSVPVAHGAGEPLLLVGSAGRLVTIGAKPVAPPPALSALVTVPVDVRMPLDVAVAVTDRVPVRVIPPCAFGLVKLGRTGRCVG